MENKQEVQKPEDKTKQAEKDTKKQLESYYEVAKHRLGRPPTMDEVFEVAAEMKKAQKSESEHPQAKQVPMPNEAVPSPETEDGAAEKGPDILYMKVYHGMKDGEGGKEPDPHKILFYESPDGSVYDVATQTWTSHRPPVVDHLMSRPISFDEQDIISAIVNGVMGDDDYEALDSRGMLGENPTKLWQLTKRLSSQMEDLESSEDLEKSDDSLDEDEPADESSPETEDGASEKEADPQDNISDSSSQDKEEPGEDHLAEIVKMAMSEALAGPYLEKTIRAIVRSELGGGKDNEENSSPPKKSVDERQV